MSKKRKPRKKDSGGAEVDVRVAEFGFDCSMQLMQDRVGYLEGLVKRVMDDVAMINERMNKQEEALRERRAMDQAGFINWLKEFVDGLREE